MTLNNNQIIDVLRNAYAQTTGRTTYKNAYDIIGTGSEVAPQYPAGSDVPISELDMQGIIDAGNSAGVFGSKEQFTKGLVNQIVKRWYTDASYRSSYKDIYFVDEARFNGIISMVSVDVPDVKENSAWKDFKTGDKIGCYELAIPVVEEQFYGLTSSWALAISLTGEQMDSAFRDAEGLAEFVNYIYLVVDNKLTIHIADLDRMNRNNFIAEKLNHASTGIQKVNLAELYCKENGVKSMTKEEYLNTGVAVRHGMSMINKYNKYLSEPSTLFNTAGKEKFVPSDRFVFTLLNDFKIAADREVMSDAFNTEYAKLGDNFQVVPYWQRVIDADGGKLTFDQVSSISLKTASDGTVSNYSGIVGLAVDKWAIMHTLIKQRVASHYFELEDVTHTEYQFVDRRINNLTLPGIVYTIEDYTAQ